ncbi:MAG: hypothetical protein IPM29_22710 [Planctomycetes bacterium]|nr:hypothetical protein [Planctomycetota bacterium]
MVLSSVSLALVCDGRTAGDLWMRPAQLAAMQEVDENDHRVARLRVPFGGRERGAIVIETRGQQGYFRNTYDLTTGLLLMGSSSTTAAATPGAGGQGGIATTITSSQLLDVRELALPWSATPGAADLRAGQQLRYRGTYTTRVPGVPDLPLDYTYGIDIRSAERGFLLCDTWTRLSSGYAPPQESRSQRALGSAQLPALLVPPDALRALRPDQVLDDDPITHFRTVFAGIQDGRAIVVEQGPSEVTRYAYDLRTGLLVDIALQQHQGVGTLVVQVALQGGS